ncbi:MAG: hypothetical protein KAT04_04320 [Methylococcales bacterium]|nr:hypothetical protein [Methylococcales bacterium]
MKPPIVIIGIGELAGVFSAGFLRCGYPVYPITRGMDLNTECLKIPTPELVLITVQENELYSVLKQLPKPWQQKVALVQNELLPRDWQQHQLKNPTVTVVWFEKKKGFEVTSILYSPCYGPSAQLMSNALQAMDIPAPILDNEEQLLYELLRKALYILTVNISGLVNNCTVGDLWLNHSALATDIAIEIIRIQESLTGQTLAQEQLISGMVEGIEDCPDRYCLGRNAPARLNRALAYAKKANIATPKLDSIYSQTKN